MYPKVLIKLLTRMRSTIDFDTACLMLSPSGRRQSPRLRLEGRCLSCHSEHSSGDIKTTTGGIYLHILWSMKANALPRISEARQKRHEFEGHVWRQEVGSRESPCIPISTRCPGKTLRSGDNLASSAQTILSGPVIISSHHSLL